MSKWAWALCDRCGFKKRHSELRAEWTELLVCSDCWDPRPPWLDPPRLDPREGAPLPNARFDVPPVFRTDENPVTPEDL